MEVKILQEDMNACIIQCYFAMHSQYVENWKASIKQL